MKKYLPILTVFTFIATLIFFGGNIDVYSVKAKNWIKVMYYSTLTVQKQVKGQFEPGNGIYLSNDFDGARLNEVALTGDNELTVTILPEHPSVKPNAWYGFKIWADETRMISLKFKYPDHVLHRYRPKFSVNGKDWNSILTGNDISLVSDKPYVYESDSLSNPVDLYIGPDTLWVAAQEIITSDDVYKWTEQLSEISFVNKTRIGSSHEGRPLYAIGIENENADKNIIVLARQYASMNVGHLAMKSFIETITDDSELSTNFRNDYNIYLFPLVNPDGVDNGHWGHNAEGFNLSDEWGSSKQPETVSVKKYIADKALGSKNDFYLNIDFRSNQNSILYVVDQDQESNMRGSTIEIAVLASSLLPEYQPVIKEIQFDNETTNAENFFYNEYMMGSLVVIIDESSTPEAIRKKGEAISTAVIQKLLSPQLIRNQ